MYRYEGSGLPNVFLKNGYELVKTRYGNGVSVRNIPGLHRCLGMAIVDGNWPITPAEFKFLRLELELSQDSLGRILGCDQQTIARWEKGRSKKIDAAAERLLRLVFRQTVSGDTEMAPLIEMLKKWDAVEPRETVLVASEKNDGWSAKSKAA